MLCDVQGTYHSFNIQADSDGETEAMVPGGVEPGDDEEGKEGGQLHSEEVSETL